MVFVLGTGVENVLIAEELNVSNFEDRVQSQSMAGLLQHLGGFNLFGRQWWDNTSIHEAVERLNIVRIPLGVYSSIGAFLDVED